MISGLRNSGTSLPDWLNINLKELDPIRKKVLYWNILFPGAGFAFSGDSLRLLLYGCGAMVLLLTGILSGWLAVHPAGLTLRTMLSRMVMPLVLLLSVVAVHVAAIFASVRSRIGSPSPRRAAIYVTCCLVLAGFSMMMLLWEIWIQAVP